MFKSNSRSENLLFAATLLVLGTLIVINSGTLIFSLLTDKKSINGIINGN